MAPGSQGSVSKSYAECTAGEGRVAARYSQVAEPARNCAQTLKSKPQLEKTGREWANAWLPG